jgi:hypothetical protein
MSRTKHDYPKLRLEYIQSEISIRELCKRNDIKNWSTVNAMKVKEDWDKAREEFRERVAEREIGALVDARMRTTAEIHQELLVAIRHAVRRFIKDLAADKEEGQTVSARDIMGMIDKFLLLTGQATSRSESKNLDLHAITGFDDVLRGAPPDLLRELAEVARSNGAGAKPVGSGPLIVLEGTRTA